MNTPTKAEQHELTDVACELADAARVATLAHFRSGGLMSESKEAHRFDPVTIADRAAEEAMRAILARRRPDDAILGEEFGPKPGTTGLTWVLDPIDGTRSYISGTPTWGVLIGLRSASGVLLGLIDQPYIGERFLGGFGTAEVTGPLGTSPLATRKPRPLSEATLFSTFPEVGTAAEGRAFRQLAPRMKLTRYGLDCYAYALLAAGQIDLVVEAGLQSYDVMAPIGVIEAAGGIVTNWQGAPALDGGRILAAANPQVHAAALEILSQAPAA